LAGVPDHGFYDASRDPGVVAAWLRRWPRALWAIRTGKMPPGSGVVVADLDRKNGKDGFATFARLTGSSELPPVPRVHTPSGGGVHLYYRAPPGSCPSTIGNGSKWRKGPGPGIDIKADRAQCHLPSGSPLSRYRWDPEFNLMTIPVLPLLPAVLTPVEIPEEEIELPATERRHVIGNPGAYATAAISKACERIRSAVPGCQRITLNAEAYTMGCLAAGPAGRSLEHSVLVAELVGAGMAMQQAAGRPAWTHREVSKTVLDGFRDGLRRPFVPQLRGRN
jgi:hypothetical protein